MTDRIYRWSPKRVEEYELSKALGPGTKAVLSFSLECPADEPWSPRDGVLLGVDDLRPGDPLL